MVSDAVLVDIRPGWHRLVLNRVDRANALSPALIDGIARALADCEADPHAKALVIEAAGSCFCNGMDIAQIGAAGPAGMEDGERFVSLLSRITAADVVVVARVEGPARGGGVGLLSACDFVFSGMKAEFALPELLWGLAPCTIAPFLIRRIGARACRNLTLSTLPIGAEEARDIGLVDSLEPDALPRLLRRLNAIPREGIGRAKRYLNAVTPIDGAVLDLAVTELGRILASPEVSGRLQTFASTNRFPWEGARNGA